MGPVVRGVPEPGASARLAGRNGSHGEARLAGRNGSQGRIGQQRKTEPALNSGRLSPGRARSASGYAPASRNSARELRDRSPSVNSNISFSGTSQASQCQSRSSGAVARVTLKLSNAFGLPRDSFPIREPVATLVELGSHRWQTSVLHSSSPPPSSTLEPEKKEERRRSSLLSLGTDTPKSNDAMSTDGPVSTAVLGVSRDFVLDSQTQLDEVLRVTLISAYGDRLVAELPLARVRSEAKARWSAACSSRTFASFSRNLRLRSADPELRVSGHGVVGDIPVDVVLHRDFVPQSVALPERRRTSNGELVLSNGSEQREKFVVRYWMHATSEDNIRRIDRDGWLVPSSSPDTRKSVLAHALAPRGVWFEANGAHIVYEGTPYPTGLVNMDGREMDVFGLMGDVDVLLGTTIGNWQLFRVDTIPGEHDVPLHVSYVVCLSDSPEFWWLRHRAFENQCYELDNNEDEYVSLAAINGGWQFSAVDASWKVQIDIFLATPHQAPIPRRFFHPEPLKLRHRPELASGVVRRGGRLSPYLYGGRGPNRSDAYETCAAMPDPQRMLGRYVPSVFALPPSLQCELLGEAVLEAKGPRRLCFDHERRMLVTAFGGVIRTTGLFPPSETQHIRILIAGHEVQPRAIGADWADGSVIVAGSDSLVRVCTDGTTEVIGEYTSKEFRCESFCLDEDGTFLVAAAGPRAILRCAPNLAPMVVVQLASAPVDMCVLADGSLLVLEVGCEANGNTDASGGTGQILHISATRLKEPEVVVSGLSKPEAFCCGPDGGLYVCHAGRVQRFTMGSSEGETLAVDAKMPKGICFDCHGHLYVSDYARNFVCRYRRRYLTHTS